MKYTEYVYTGAPIPQISEQEHTAFFMNIQRAILFSLEKRNLLTRSQREKCESELEKQYSEHQRRERRA